MEMYKQGELPGFRVSPMALWPNPNVVDWALEKARIFEAQLGGVLGPEFDQGLSSIYSIDEIYDLFCGFCKHEISFTETPDGIYPDNSYDANLLEYFKTFVVPRYSKHQNRLTDVILDPQGNLEDAVVMNGAFNGVPHPGWIEALTLVKRKFPNKRLVVGVASNFEIENVKIEYPEGDTKWRASLLAGTGIVDGVFAVRDSIFELRSGYTGYPNGGLKDVTSDYDGYWSSVFGGGLSGKFPSVVVANGRDEAQRKSVFINPEKTEIFDLSEQPRIFANFHSSQVHRKLGYTADYVKSCWYDLRRLEGSNFRPSI